MRVDDVPLILKPAFHAYGYGMGAALQSGLSVIRHTCRIDRVTVNPPRPRIECIWHEHLPAYLATYFPPSSGPPYVWMNHPLWYMRPVHVVLGWAGIEEVVLGSTGHGGRAALEVIVEFLKRGYRTSLAVDGPAGPFHDLKRGALDMAVESACPVVPIRFEYARSARAPGWDKKHFPMPFSRIRIVEGEPLHVTRDNYEWARAQLRIGLG